VKRIAVIILGLIVGLIAFLTVRTIVYPWRRQIEAGTAARIQIDADAVARKLSEAVRFRTISQDEPSANDPGQLVAFREWLERTYPTVHSKLQREVVGDYSILYTWPGTDAALAPVMLLAHMDVVPVQPESENLWVHPPFAGAISDGYVWGRGTLDMKTTLVGVMEAAEREITSGKQPRRTIMIGLGHDEEAGGADGAKAIARLLKARGVRLEWVLDEGSVIADGIVAGLGKPLALIGVAEKGYLTAQIVVTAPGGHSAIPPYETAVTKLARVITRIQENPLPAKVDGAASGLLASLGPYLPIVQRTAIANQWLVWLVSQSRSLEVYGDECSVTNNICTDHAFRQSERKRAAQRSSRHRKRANTSTRHS